ncbi:MAG: hypothetical protein U0414_30095 [Polyangiaceae bacterium]
MPSGREAGWITSLSALFATVIGVQACGVSSSDASSTGPPDDDDPRSEQARASADFAAAWCEARARCLPTAFADEYQDVATCVERNTTVLLRSRFGEGSNTTPEDIDACAAGIDFSTCDGWSKVAERRGGPSCHVPGALVVGDACFYDRQCASLYCAHAGFCGVCAPQQPVGGACTEAGGCVFGAACWGTCTPFVEHGAPCGPGVGVCSFSQSCMQGVCAPRLGLDAPCDPTTDVCQTSPVQLACQMSPPRCAPYVTHAFGEACGGLADGTVANCVHGMKCRSEGSDHPERGICQPAAEDGAVCGGTWLFEGQCTSPAICAPDRCAIPDATACTLAAIPP